jgi:hypothetical protein
MQILPDGVGFVLLVQYYTCVRTYNVVYKYVLYDEVKPF